MCNCGTKEKSESSRSSRCHGKKNSSYREHDLEVAKAILQRRSNYSGDNVFDHLCDLIKRIIDEDPPNVADYFDEYSRIVREEKFHIVENNLITAFNAPASLSYACNVMKSFKISLYPPLPNYGEEEEHKPEQEVEEKVLRHNSKDIMQMQFYWSLCGRGLEQEVFLLSHSIEKFEKHPLIRNCRFWGKMFGLKNNYYILEVDLKPEEIVKRIEQMKRVLMEKTRASQKEDDQAAHAPEPYNELIAGWSFTHYPSEQLAEMNIKQPGLPRSYYQKPIDVPPEIVGRGLNRKSYFVCNDPLDDWIELPIVTPKQVSLSRVIKKYLTGDLEAAVTSYPPFPGKEKHYLRALIARISAGCQIAPVGYMKIGKEMKLNGDNEDDNDEEEEAEEEEDQETGGERDVDKPIIENVNYKFLSVENLQKMENWQHIRPAILTQGRVVAYDERKYRKELDIVDEEDENEEEEEEVEEEEEGGDKIRMKQEFAPEMGPPLFAKINEDIVDLHVPSWTIRESSRHVRKNLVVVVRSNIWPGAYAFAMENMVDNIYVGWGVKYERRNFSPPPLPDVQEEYPIGPEILEILDPSVKQEDDWLIAHTKVEKPPETASEEDEEEGEEEEEEDEV